MYEGFFGFTQAPFSVTADPDFIYFSGEHKEAFSTLLYGVKMKKGFIALTGEVGTGKTTLCKALFASLDKNIKTAFIFNPDLSETQMLQAILEEFGIESKKKAKVDLFNQLNSFLIEQLALSNNVVLIIDESQNLKTRTLEQIRLISNLETDKEKLIQIIFSGQPELHKKLSGFKLRQLNQRIGIRCHLSPLKRHEVEEYIRHRMNVAGPSHRVEFSYWATDLIYRFSRGTPRLINLACDRALLAGYAKQTLSISEEIIKSAIAEINSIGPRVAVPETRPVEGETVS